MTIIDSQLQQQMQAWRRDIHQHPETAYEEWRTSELVTRVLKDLGLEVHTQMAETGVIGILKGNKGAGKGIALRADMDALNLDELNNFDYVSKHQGKMHACGHDGHTAMLLGAATVLAKQPDFAGTLYFIFQPAEEGDCGAKRMIDEGLFTQFAIDEIYGMHNWPGLEAGTFAVHSGAVMAAVDELKITVQGQGGHAGIPHNVKDPIVASAHLISSIQTIVSRNIPMQESAVISITQIHAGDAYNIIPDSVKLGGTIRSFDKQQREMIKTRLAEICEGISKAFSVDIDLSYQNGCPATVNHSTQAEYARAVCESIVGKDNVAWNLPPSGGAEDFAFMLEEKPGAYIWLGNGGEESSCELHNPRYDFNDNIAATGARYWVELALQRLN